MKSKVISASTAQELQEKLDAFLDEEDVVEIASTTMTRSEDAPSEKHVLVVFYLLKHTLQEDWS